MPYIKIIETSTSWTCPKTSFYKVICVGGGSSNNNSLGGAGALNAAVFSVEEGTTVACTVGKAGSSSTGRSTSFGNYLSAAQGALSVQFDTQMTRYTVGGRGGYTIDGTYGGCGSVEGTLNNVPVFLPPTKNGGSSSCGLGWGAGGSFTRTESSSYSGSASDGVIIISEE